MKVRLSGGPLAKNQATVCHVWQQSRWHGEAVIALNGTIRSWQGASPARRLRHRIRPAILCRHTFTSGMSRRYAVRRMAVGGIVRRPTVRGWVTPLVAVNSGISPQHVVTVSRLWSARNRLVRLGRPRPGHWPAKVKSGIIMSIICGNFVVLPGMLRPSGKMSVVCVGTSNVQHPPAGRFLGVKAHNSVVWHNGLYGQFVRCTIRWLVFGPAVVAHTVH